jgi:hypothetical protein
MGPQALTRGTSIHFPLIFQLHAKALIFISWREKH